MVGYMKTRGMGAGRKLKSHCGRQRWADKSYKKSHLGNEWKKPFAGSSHTKGICVIVQLIKNGKKIDAFVPNDDCLNYIEENTDEELKKIRAERGYTYVVSFVSGVFFILDG
ncbi:hypothetical protein MKX03_022954 [Papaver bracteatum]|nr:hypothetical protein MKX03_022954 [Papaver bracteatum]